jgi:hypothetical protein
MVPIFISRFAFTARLSQWAYPGLSGRDHPLRLPREAGLDQRLLQAGTHHRLRAVNPASWSSSGAGPIGRASVLRALRLSALLGLAASVGLGPDHRPRGFRAEERRLDRSLALGYGHVAPALWLRFSRLGHETEVTWAGSRPIRIASACGTTTDDPASGAGRDRTPKKLDGSQSFEFEDDDIERA